MALKVLPLMGMPGVGLTNTTIKENLTDSGIQYQTLQALFDRFQPDGIFTFMDLTVEAENLGLKIQFPENDTPSVLKHDITDLTKLNALEKNYKGFSGRMNVFTETVKKLKGNIQTLIGSYVIGPFTLAGELTGVNELLTYIMLDPDFTRRLVDFSCEVVTDYCTRLFQSGADVVCVLEPTGMMLSPEMYEEYSLKPFISIKKSLSHQPLILHVCGNTTHLIDSMIQSSAFGLSLDSDVDFKKIIKKIPKEMELMGNINPVKVFLNGNEKIVTNATKKLIDEMAPYDNFVLSGGCDLPLKTPLENISVFMETARSEK